MHENGEMVTLEWLLQQWTIRQELVRTGLLWLIQLVILTGLFGFIYVKYIRKSQAEQLLKGLFVILIIFMGMWLLALALQLPMLEKVFAASIQILFIGLIVIFQPELRRMLLFLGQGELFGGSPATRSPEEQKAGHLIQELTETVKFLSKAKRGALIVLESTSRHGGDYLEMGTLLDAKLSAELMLTIFHHNTPLHDGAVVIGPDNRVVAAGVLLPLTEDPKLSWQYGTRHRAAIGLTEISDSRCIVVSEETGAISLVEGGKLEKMANAEELRKALSRYYAVSEDSADGGDVVLSPETKMPLGKKLSIFFSGDSRLGRLFEGDREQESRSGSSGK